MIRDGRVVFISGSSRGIGLATAKAFLALGDTVVINGRDGTRLDAALSELRSRSGSAAAVAADVTIGAQVNRAGKEIEERFGRLDVLVNNAGSFVFAGALSHSEAQWREVLDSNLTSVYLVCKEMLPLLKRGSHARIVNIAASYAGLLKAFPRFGPYAAAKAGLVSLTKSLAAELAPAGITVNSVSPGLIDTGSYAAETIERWKRLVPAGRFGGPEEVARAVVFLADPASDYITGADLAVSGGWEGQSPQGGF